MTQIWYKTSDLHHDLISTQGVLAIPIAFASMATAEAVVLGALLGLRLRRRLERQPM